MPMPQEIMDKFRLIVMSNEFLSCWADPYPKKVLGGEVYQDNGTQKEQLKVLYGQKTDECVQPIANDLPFELRLMHHFVCIFFTPKPKKYEYVSEKELFFLWASILRLICFYLFWTTCSRPP